MAKDRKKVYFVKREAIARTLKEAMTKPGSIYEIQLAEEKLWPEEKKNIGFTKKE